jgi:hypothetical protein
VHVQDVLSMHVQGVTHGSTWRMCTATSVWGYIKVHVEGVISPKSLIINVYGGHVKDVLSNKPLIT